MGARGAEGLDFRRGGAVGLGRDALGLGPPSNPFGSISVAGRHASANIGADRLPDPRHGHRRLLNHDDLLRFRGLGVAVSCSCKLELSAHRWTCGRVAHVEDERLGRCLLRSGNYISDDRVRFIEIGCSRAHIPHHTLFHACSSFSGSNHIFVVGRVSRARTPTSSHAQDGAEGEDGKSQRHKYVLMQRDCPSHTGSPSLGSMRSVA